MSLLNQKYTLLIPSLLLFVLPFLWFSYPAIDLGGDSSRLYFQDPGAYLQHNAIWEIIPEGIGFAEPHHYHIPFVGLLYLLNIVGISPFFLSILFHGLKLSLSFFGIYLVISEILSISSSENKKNISIIALVTGLFYLFMPTMTGNWDTAIMSHNQIFLNPLMFYLLLKLLLTDKMLYGYFILVVSFIFASNFAYTSAPAIFSFYPIALLYLILYIRVIHKKKIKIKNIVLLVVLGFGVHLFHILPQLAVIFNANSVGYARLFGSDSGQNSVNYVYSVSSLVRVSRSVLGLTSDRGFIPLAFIPILIVLIGIRVRSYKGTLLTGFFYVATLFLLTGIITNIGFTMYAKLFYIPGFSMFRNYIGQWLFVYSFFSALLVGQSLMHIARVKKQLLFNICIFLLSSAAILSGYPLVSGAALQHSSRYNKGFPNGIVFDNSIKELLTYIRALPDGNILTLPLTDSYYQILMGSNDGLYIGPSIISSLTDKRDFSGYQLLQPYAEKFLAYSKDKKYEDVKNILVALGIRYIVLNSDNRIYDTDHIGNPYIYVEKFLPENSSEYERYITSLGARERYKSGNYTLYELLDIYSFGDLGVATIVQDGDIPTLVENDTVSFSYIKHNPAYYTLRFSTDLLTQYPVQLVLFTAYNPGWELKVQGGDQKIAKHEQILEYGNGWLLDGRDFDKTLEYTTMTLQLRAQKRFIVYSGISILSLTATLYLLTRSLYKK